MYPKVAVVCGAHTELGKHVVRELLRSDSVEQVYALAEVDCRDSLRVRPEHREKLVLIVHHLDYIERILSASVPECDIAFSCLGSSKKDFARMGSYQFHKINLDIPSRFIREMYELGAQRIAVLSHAGADPRSRKSEFLRVKGELEHFIAEMHKEACSYGPGITLFQVPLLLTNLKDQNGLRGSSITASQRFEQKAALKFNASPARAVHVRDVAKAMCADTLEKVDVEEESDLATAFARQRTGFCELSGPDIVGLADGTRAIEHHERVRELQEGEAQSKVSQFARAQRALAMRGYALAASERSTMFGEDFDSEDDDVSGAPSRDSERPESIPHGSTGEVAPDFGDDFREDDEDHFDDDESLGVPGTDDGSYMSAHMTAGSVEALRNQLARRLTIMEGNTLLPDLQPHLPQRAFRRHGSPKPGGSIAYGFPGPSASSSHSSQRQSGSVVHGSPSPGAPVIHSSPRQGNSISHSSPRSSTSIAQNSPGPGASITHSSPKSGASVTHSSPKSGASVTHSSPQPGASITHGSPRPGASVTHNSPRPGASITHSSPRPGASISHSSPRPGMSIGNSSVRPSGSIIQDSPLPSASTLYVSPRLNGSMAQNSPRPGAPIAQSSPGPRASIAHSSPRPSASIAHSSPRQSTSVGHTSPRPNPSVPEVYLEPTLTGLYTSPKPRVTGFYGSPKPSEASMQSSPKLSGSVPPSHTASPSSHHSQPLQDGVGSPADGAQSSIEQQSLRSGPAYREGAISAASKGFDEGEQRMLFVPRSEAIVSALPGEEAPIRRRSSTKAMMRLHDERYYYRGNHPSLVRDPAERSRRRRRHSTSARHERDEAKNSSGRLPKSMATMEGPSRLSVLASKVMSATERPSTRRMKESRPVERDASMRGGADLRALGQTVI